MNKSREDLLLENELLQSRLDEATDTLEAIRTGQVDALVVSGQNGHSLYTLKSADQAYRLFIEQMAEGAVSLNSDGLIVFSNSQFARIIDQPLSGVSGRNFEEFVIDDDKPKFRTLFADARKGNIESELCLKHNDNNVPVKVSLNTILLHDDLAISMIVTDLTRQKEIEKQLTTNNEELKRLNEALISSNHDLQQFASVASHDLQEPLRKIQVFSNILKDRSQVELTEASKEYVEKIIASAQRMKVLIIDILTYSKLSADENIIEEIDLTTLFKDIFEDFDLKISERNANVELDQLCVVEGNKGQLRQVFQNLVSNALKFVSPDRKPKLSIRKTDFDAKELGVSLDHKAAYCRITVSDNGIGFNEKYSSAIFDLFEKLNPKATYEGSGIGLAIAKKIIDKHHGIIIAKSTIGLGSEFNVILPLKQPKSTQ